jgi:nitrogen fixation/metabolism regulation signal transduction histidine kinase
MAAVIIGVAYYTPINYSRMDVFRETLKSNGVEAAVEFLISNMDSNNDYMRFCFFLIFISSIFIWLLKWRTQSKERVWRFIVFNIIFTFLGVAVVIPNSFLSENTLTKWATSDRGQESIFYFFSPYAEVPLFLICFTLLFLISKSLWRMSEKKLECKTEQCPDGGG